jgi:hypothetical protein
VRGHTAGPGQTWKEDQAALRCLKRNGIPSGLS